MDITKREEAIGRERGFQMPGNVRTTQNVWADAQFPSTFQFIKGSRRAETSGATADVIAGVFPHFRQSAAVYAHRRASVR